MLPTDLTQLDNPLWHALTGAQQAFAVGTSYVKRYRPGILPFAAYDYNAPEKITDLDDFLEKDKVFFLVGELPSLPAHWELIRELPCVQMVLGSLSTPVQGTADVMPLTTAHRDVMLELIHRVQPGYYERDTHRLGDYFGIWQNNRLAAIAGERMCLDGLVEISAVCTEPAYTGRGYAQQLMTHICRKNQDNGEKLFLHVLSSNERAIGLYKHLGFKERRSISFWKLVRRGI